MKIYIATILTILVMAVGTANAQNINIGTKIGLNSYNISNNNGSSYDSKVGMHAGILGHIHLLELGGTSGYFALQPELVYSTQGAKSGNTTLNLDYLNIPVLLQYMFDNGFRIQAGPQLGLLVRAKADNSVDIKDNYKSIDVGLSMGVSYIHVPTSFGIDFRYNHGLSDITEASAISNSRGIQVGIFYLFNHTD